MKKYILVLMLLGACTSSSKEVSESQIDSNSVATSVDTVVTTPVSTASELGERVAIEGDFDGDGKKETLQEHYISRKTGKELSRIYPEMEYDSLIGFVLAQHPRLYLSCTHAAVKDFDVTDNEQLFGFLHLKNEGDLNGDGTDDISYILNYADMSTVNRFYIYTFRKGQWQELASFPIREWQMEDEKPLFVKNTEGAITAKTFDEEANEVQRTIFLKK